jgi:hypothetical protein
MNATVAAEKVTKNARLHQAIEGALAYLDAHADQPGYRLPYDKAIHILGAIKRAGFNIVRKHSGEDATP